MLEIKNVCFKRNNRKILDNINLRLDETKFYVITGPNGSGKSTLAKIIVGIEKPDSGSVIFNGTDITSLPIDERAKLGVGFAFQQPVRFKGVTVYDLLKIATGKKLSKDEACVILSRVGLCAKEYVNREIDASLSGGELKRIEIASVIAKNPKLAIFDEPEAGIDLWSFQSLTEVFKEIESSYAGITLVISHQERILNIADQIILMKDGKITKTGSKNDMLSEIFNKVQCPRGVGTCEQS
ncbi:MAG: ATP-binding cassette domain-containing protein [Bacilli bacterium]|nr:ATP-binding cassette domain-containing protein [Bacilli bacterium]